MKLSDTDKSALKSQLASLAPSWAEVDEYVVEQLLDSAQVVELGTDDFVFRIGDLCSAFLILLAGRIRVQLISEGGREVTLYRIDPGGSCFLTTSCLLSQEHYPAEAIAEEKISALAVPSSVFSQLLENSTWFRAFVFDGFSGRLTDVIEKIEEIAFTPIDKRLATVLLELDARKVHRVTHHDLAVELGTAREVVSRHLKQFERHGLLKLGRGRISIVDRPRLADLSAQP